MAKVKLPILVNQPVGAPFSTVFAPCCNELLVSQHRHDFQPCSCGKVFVDGGAEYFRTGGNGLNVYFDPMDQLYDDMEDWFRFLIDIIDSKESS